MKSLTSAEQKAINAFLRAKRLPTDTAVTFDDVALPERFSSIRSRSEVNDFSTDLISKTLTLNIPFISANMESVTGAEMVIALEREGGLGIIPQTLSIEEKVHTLEKIKRSDCALIERPLTTTSKTSLLEAKKTMNTFGVKGLVVVDASRKPIGVLSTRDWFYEENGDRRVGELMTKDPITAPVNISFAEAKKILRKHKIEKLPLVSKAGILAGLITAHGLLYEKHHPRALRNEKGQFIRIGSIGVSRKFSDKNLEHVAAQVELGITALLVDTARAYSINTAEAITNIKSTFPNLPLIAGNISTPEGAKFLFELGVDVVKIGQGPGEACRTREVGIGIPQLTAVASCSVIAQRYQKTVIADGGIKNPGDIVKALVAGASSVMIGFLFAGTDESSGQAYPYHSKEFGTDITVKDYIGVASFVAQRERLNQNKLQHMRRPEGIKRTVPVIGPMTIRINDLLDGLRSAMSYLGVTSIQELQKEGIFTPQTRAGLIEGIGEN